MGRRALAVVLAFLPDAVLGDPKNPRHPIRLIDPLTGAKPAQKQAEMQAQFDYLADIMQEHLDIPRILDIMGLEAIKP